MLQAYDETQRNNRAFHKNHDETVKLESSALQGADLERRANQLGPAQVC
jgi:hypothetical protein